MTETTIGEWWDNISKRYPDLKIKGLVFSITTNKGENLLIAGEEIKGNGRKARLIGIDCKTREKKSLSGATTLLAAGKRKKEKIKIPSGLSGAWAV